MLIAPTLEKLNPTAADRVIILKDFQRRFVNSPARYPAMVSAWGTAKTLCGITKVMKLAQEYPNNLIYVLRKEWVDLRDSTIKDFETYTGIKVNSDRDVVLPNGTTIMFRHLEEIKKGGGKGRNLQNINLGVAWIEQAEELESDEEFWMLSGRLRRAGVKHCLMITANTNGHNWIYKLWKTGALTEHIERLKKEKPELFDKDFVGMELVEATTYDNADVLPKEFIASIELLKLQKPKTFERMVMNSWEESDTNDLIIQPVWVEQSKYKNIDLSIIVRKVVSIDVGYGRDKTMMYAVGSDLIGNVKHIARQELDLRDTMQICGHAVIFANRHGIKVFAVDEIGVGAGVKDRLMEMGHPVVAVNSAMQSNEKDKYSNIRGEIYGHGSNVFAQGLVSIPVDDQDLADQLTWTKFKSVRSNGRVEIESKDLVRERYGRSPDNADAFLNGLWALKFVNLDVSRRDVNGWQGKSYVPQHPNSARPGFKELIPS